MSTNIEPLTVKGTVSYVIRHNIPDTSIFFIDAIDGSSVKVIANLVANSQPPIVGEVWSIKGRYDEDDQYGEQIIADEVSPLLPSGKLITDFLINNSSFTGVGIQTVKKLWAAFGDELYDILTRGDADLILSKVNIHPIVLNNMIDVWSEYADIIPIVRYLNSLDFNVSIARKAREFWGKDTIDKITDDPYRLLAFGRWKEVDDCALNKLNTKPDSYNRLVAAVEASIYNRYDKQDTASEYNELRNSVGELLGNSINPEQAILKSLSDGRIVTTKVDGELLYQSFGVAAIESYISNRIKKIEDGENHQQSLFNLDFSNKRLSDFEDTLGYPLASEQRDAIKMVVENNFAVITGGAGVGKTTVLNGIFYMLPDNAIIMQAAPTNRAAARMRESTGHDAITIAKLLRIAKGGPLPDNLYLFIDEASMLDAPTFYRLLKALPVGTRLYLVGDHHQLPPIGPGLILHLFVFHNYPNVVELTQVHRQGNETGIPQIANSIRLMSSPKLKKFKGGCFDSNGISILEVKNKRELLNNILTTYRELCTYGETQIVAARNITCENVNSTLHQENLSAREYMKSPTPILNGMEDEQLTIGDKVIYKDHNNSQKDLYNGSLGVLTDIYENSIFELDEDGNDVIYIAEAEFDTSGPVRLSEDDFEHVGLGYSITVHKSQGSQWERVVIASEFIFRDSPIVDNSWFYTAITRCQKQAVIVGSLNNFNYQVTHPPRSFTRKVGLSFKPDEE